MSFTMLRQRSAATLTRASIRHYATPAAKPAMNGSTSKQDADLWKAYNSSLRNHVLKGTKFDPKTQSFYTAPLGVMGVPVGQNIPVPVTNMSLYNIADSLLDANSPVFTPGTGSYIDRQERYLGAVQLKKNTNAGAALRHQTAVKKQEVLQAKMDGISEKAKSAFTADADKGNMPFPTWVSRNYPQYDSLKSELQAAANATDSAAIDLYGPGAAELNRRREWIRKAKDNFAPTQGLNMKVSDALANVKDDTPVVPDENAMQEYRPTYSIDKGYADAVRAWIDDSSAASGTARPTVIDIDISKSSSETWANSGFSNTSATVGARYWFISASTTVESTTKTENLSAEQLGSGVKARLSAVGIKTFDVKPGAWDGDFGKLYSGKDISMLANFELPPACAVSQVVMGYNVSLDITLDSHAAKQVSDLYERTSKTGGSISFFGMTVGLGAGGQRSDKTAAKYSLTKNSGDFSSISITGEDGGYPVILGVIGRKLAEYKH